MHALQAGQAVKYLLTQSQSIGQQVSAQLLTYLWCLSFIISLSPAHCLCFLCFIWLLDRADPLKQGPEPIFSPSRWAPTFWFTEFSSSLLHSTIPSAVRQGWFPTLAGDKTSRVKGIKCCFFPTQPCLTKKKISVHLTVHLIAED